MAGDVRRRRRRRRTSPARFLYLWLVTLCGIGGWRHARGVLFAFMRLFSRVSFPACRRWLST